jgi:hypothetical protein
VIVPEQMAEPVDGQPFQLRERPAARRPSSGRLDGDDDVPQSNPVAGRIAFARQLLEMKAEHIGGAIDAAVPTIELPNLLVVREHQGGRRARPSEGSQGGHQTGPHLAPSLSVDEAARSPAHQDRDRH